MSVTMKEQSGFTIVELLIVIVVIAILAAISIVAYTGIQQRATNSKNANEAAQVAKLLESYKALHGSYPAASSAAVCVGEGFSNHVGDSRGDCWDTIANTVYSVEVAFNTELKTMGSLPSNPSACIPYSPVCFTGPVYATGAAPNQPSPAGPSVRFWVYGENCPAGQKVWGPTSVASQCSIKLSS